MTDGSRVDVTLEDGRLVLTPRRARITLAQILATMPDEAGKEIDMGPDVGEEVLPPH